MRHRLSMWGLLAALCLLSACGTMTSDRGEPFNETNMKEFLFDLLETGAQKGTIRFEQKAGHEIERGDVDRVIYDLSENNGAYIYLVDETKWSFMDYPSYVEVEVSIDYREGAVSYSEIPDTETETEAVLAVSAALGTGETEVVLTTSNSDWTMDTVRLIGAAAADHDPLGVLYGSYTYSIMPETGGESRVLTIAYESQVGEETRKELLRELGEKLETMAVEVRTRGAAEEEELYRAVHDMVVTSAEYDLELRDAVAEGRRGEEELIRSTAYGALVEQRTVCSGYAAAFQALCDRLNLPCWTVVGQSDGEDHSWNLVRLDGVTYCVDCTFDSGTKSDKYFLFTEDDPQYEGYHQEQTILPWQSEHQ